MLPQQRLQQNGTEGLWILLSLEEFKPWHLLSEMATELWKGLA